MAGGTDAAGCRPAGMAWCCDKAEPRVHRGSRLTVTAATGRRDRAILTSLGLPTEPPTVHPARGPPDELLWE